MSEYMKAEFSIEDESEKGIPINDVLDGSHTGDKYPVDVTDMEGKRWVYIPKLISMKKVLFSRYKRSLYLYLNKSLRTGELSGLIGCQVLDQSINREVCEFQDVSFWRIDSENFYADVNVRLNLTTRYGKIAWKGVLTCWCNFGPQLSVSYEGLSTGVDRDGCDLLSKYLVPCINNERIDKIAEELWELYCEEALTDPRKRNAVMLAKRLGLTIMYCPVYEHGGVDSIVFFKEDVLELGEDRVVKDANGVKRTIKAEKGKETVIPAYTIVINTNRRKREYSDIDIYHECYHFHEHYLFYCLQELASDDCRQVPVEKVLVDKDEEVKDSLFFIENQAERGSVGLMMPATHTKKLIWDERGKVRRFDNQGELYETIGKALHKKLSVPEFRVRQRMIQLGHVRARGALNRANRLEIAPFAFEPDSWRDSNHTFVIDTAKVNALRERNEDFRYLMDTGKYIYADGHVVKNEPAYVYWDDRSGKHLLTDWARAHVDRCCLRFARKYVQKNVGRYVYGRLYYDPDYVRQCEFYLSDIINEKQLSIPNALYEYEKDYPETFKEALEKLMHKNGETQETLAPKLGTTDRTLRNWLEDPKRFFTVDRMVKLSLIWKLPDFISRLFLESNGIILVRRDKRDRALMYILDVLWDQGVDTANKFLVENDFSPLSA